MRNLTQLLPQELIASIQKITQCQHPIILEISNGDMSCPFYNHSESYVKRTKNMENIFSFWLNLQGRNTNWSYAAIDEETARKFNISARTVRRIRKKLSNVVQTII